MPLCVFEFRIPNCPLLPILARQGQRPCAGGKGGGGGGGASKNGGIERKRIFFSKEILFWSRARFFFLFLAILFSFFYPRYFFLFLCVAKEEDIGLSRQSRNRFLNLFPVFLTGNPGVPGFFLINKQRSTINYVLSLILSYLKEKLRNMF